MTSPQFGAVGRAVVRLIVPVAIAGAAVVAGGSVAQADPGAPGCTAADLARVSSGVAAATSDYLFAHPDVNDFFTSLHGQPYDQMHQNVTTYMNEHPDVHADLTGIRQPVTDLRARCQ